jgi:hypothetical protein
VISQWDKSFHIGVSLLFKATTVRGVEPLGQIILPWRLCLQASTPAKYSLSGIVIASLSPLKHGCGNWGISQTLESACARDLCGFDTFLVGFVV